MGYKEEQSQDAQRAKGQAESTLECIIELLDAFDGTLTGDMVTYDHARYDREGMLTMIQEFPLCVMVRSLWAYPGEVIQAPGEYRLELSTGGPAVQMVGTLDRHSQPDTAKLQYCGNHTPWSDLLLATHQTATLLRFASFFYFGE